MGCGSSRAQGRDNYGLLDGDPDNEPFTPLVRAEPEEPPRLDSFLTELEASRDLGDSSDLPSSKYGKSSQQSYKPSSVLDQFAPFTLNSFDLSNREINTSKEQLSTHQNNNNFNKPPAQSAPIKPIPSSGFSGARQQDQKVSPRIASSGSNISNTGFPDLRDSKNDFENSGSFNTSGFGSSFGGSRSSGFEQSSQSRSKTTTPKPVPIVPVVTPVILDQASRTPAPSVSQSPDPLNTSSSKKSSKKKRRKSSKDGKESSASLESSNSGEKMNATPQKQLGMHMDTPEPSSGSGMRFDELYRLKGVLGTGAFSTVREGCHRSSATNTYAVKCVNRKKLSEEDEAALLDEVSILKEMKHKHIIRLYDFFVEPATYYLVMERMSGGELFDRIVAKAYYNEKEARDVCKIVLEAVGYLHDHNVAHRDLKPENLLLLSENDDSQVKIADFGFAKKVFAPQSLTTQCGTPGYVAPEILEGIPYDTRADMWSVGVILYILLGGYPPFIENNQRDLFRKIRRGEYEFHEEYWGAVSKDAKELISSLLTVDPVTRLDANQALGNRWICADDGALAKRDLGTNLKNLTTYNAKRKFKAAVSTVMAVNKLKSLGVDFLKNLS